jgi:hypothetical protein
LLFASDCFAEDMTITTYYPSPYGSYNELTAHKMKIGTTYSGIGTAISDNNLIVQGTVGIGDPTPDNGLKLDVEGNVGATQYCDQNGNNCFVTNGMRSSNVTRAILFSVRCTGASSFVVESTRILLTDDPTDFNYGVVITSVSRPSDGYYLLTAHFRNYYIDSDEVISATLVLKNPDGSGSNAYNKITMCDKNGNNRIEFITSDDNSLNNLIVGDEIKFMVVWPAVN